MGTNLQLFVPKFYFLYKMGTKTAVSVPKGQFQGATGTESALFVPIIWFSYSAVTEIGLFSARRAISGLPPGRGVSVYNFASATF